MNMAVASFDRLAGYGTESMVMAVITFTYDGSTSGQFVNMFLHFVITILVHIRFLSDIYLIV